LLKLELLEFLPINQEQTTGSGLRKQVSHYNSQNDHDSNFGQESEKLKKVAFA
jgi:hypothetical protein